MRSLRNSLVLIAVIAAALFAMRAPGDPALFPATDAPVSIHVVNNGWHSGLIVWTNDLRKQAIARQDRAPDEALLLLDLVRAMGQADWIEIGWGDEAFYRADVAGLADVPVWTGIKALFGSSPTLFHIYPGSGEPALVFHHSDVIALDLSEAGFARIRVIGEFGFSTA